MFLLVRSFAIGKYEVTFAEWDACTAGGGCKDYRPSDSGWGRGTRPVINVNWDDAKAYTGWLSKKTGKRYRLVSESEWEYAARAGTTTARYWGDSISSGNANCWGCGSQWDNGQTAPAGRFATNAFGLHDILGNVWEWTEDCWNHNYDAAPRNGSAWISGNCDLRILRGGSWNRIPGVVRAAVRYRHATSYRSNYGGFRVARTLAD